MVVRYGFGRECDRAVGKRDPRIIGLINERLFDLYLISVPLPAFFIEPQKRDIDDVLWVVSTPAGQSNWGCLIDVGRIVVKALGPRLERDRPIVIQRIVVVGIANLNKCLIDWI